MTNLKSSSIYRHVNVLIPLTVDAKTMSMPSVTLPIKASMPIEHLSTDPARFFSLSQPVILLSAYYFRFPALVADPISTLLSSLLPLAVVQIAYTTICLPATGSEARLVKKAKAGTRRTGNSAAKGFTVFLALILSLLSVPALAAIQILFGAPITTHIPHTLLSSAHLALLTVFPLVYVHGADGTRWKEIMAINTPVDEVFGGAIGGLLGAWVGAVPIPLDWDREWQKWPVTIVTGAYAGYIIGELVGGRMLKGKVIKLD